MKQCDTCASIRMFVSSCRASGFSIHLLNFFSMYCTVSVKKKSPRGLSEFFSFFHKRLRIFIRFFTHPLYVIMYAGVQIFMQLSPTLTKICYIKRNNLVHVICAKCPKRAKTRAFRRLRKSLIALLIVVCGKSL